MADLLIRSCVNPQVGWAQGALLVTLNVEQQVVDTIMKRRRTEPAYETAHQASTKVIEQAVHKKPSFNPFVSHQTSQAVEKSFGEKNAFLFL